jgi:hypothetical protein
VPQRKPVVVAVLRFSKDHASFLQIQQNATDTKMANQQHAIFATSLLIIKRLNILAGRKVAQRKEKKRKEIAKIFPVLITSSFFSNSN